MFIHWFTFAISFKVWTRNRRLSDSAPLFFRTVMDHLHVFSGVVESHSKGNAVSVGQNKTRGWLERTQPIQMTCMSVANVVVCRLFSLVPGPSTSLVSPVVLKKKKIYYNNKNVFSLACCRFGYVFFLIFFASKSNIYSCFNPTIFFLSCMNFLLNVCFLYMNIVTWWVVNCFVLDCLKMN